MEFFNDGIKIQKNNDMKMSRNKQGPSILNPSIV